MNMNYSELIINKNHALFEELNKLKSAETNLYLVGGYIRDLILGKDSFDKDFIVQGENAIEFAQKVAENFDGHFVLLDSENGIARVVMPDKTNYLDFAACLNNSIEDDIRRRDFTVNSIAFDMQACEVLDLEHGVEDINNKLIRTCSLENMTDDALRILRAYRFSAQLGFNIDAELDSFINKNLDLIDIPAKERVNTELIKLFEGDYASQILIDIKNNGLLYRLLPVLKDQEKVPPNLHHHLCLIDHSIETVRQVEEVLLTLDKTTKDYINADFVTGVKRLSLLKIAALLHDIGKFETWTVEEDGRHRFIGHEELGSKMAINILKELKFSNNAIKYMEILIKHHIYPSQLLKEEEVSQKAILRMFRRLGTETPDVIVLAMADRLSARGVEITDEIVEKNLKGLNWLLEKYYEEGEKVKNLPKLLSGHEVSEILGIPKGKLLGVIIKQLQDAQVIGEVLTKDQAIDYIKTLTLDE